MYIWNDKHAVSDDVTSTTIQALVPPDLHHMHWLYYR